MARKNLPIYNIKNFEYDGHDAAFYANKLSLHIKQHDFIHAPHKHDFFFVALCTKGSGIHKIDFVEYVISPGTIFLLSPGQAHSWRLSNDAEGYLFFHTKAFFNLHFQSKKILDFPFFCSMHNSPVIHLKNNSYEKTEIALKEIFQECRRDYLMKTQRIYSLVDLLYIDLSRLYLPSTIINKQNSGFLIKVRKLEDLIDANFKNIKSPGEYANRMFISEKHLNRICKACLNKTVSELIIDRIMLEAKRLLVQSKYSVTEIAEGLGYYDVSYFSRLFKKNCSQTPSEFVKTHSSAAN